MLQLQLQRLLLNKLTKRKKLEKRRKKIIKEHFPVCVLEWPPAPGFEELVYNQGYFKAFLYFGFLVFIPRYTKPYPVHCYFHPNGLGRWVASMYNRFNTSTLPHTFHQYYIYIFGGKFYTKCKQNGMDMPMVWRRLRFLRGWGWRGHGGEEKAWELCHRL